MSATIRPMAVSDVERVAEIAAGLAHAPHWPISTYQEIPTQSSESMRIALVAYEMGAGVVGFAIARTVASQAELESIAVVPAFQRNGVARRLFEELEAVLRRAEVTEVHLEVRTSNQAALRLYQALGFQETGRRKGYYADPVEDAVLMRLEIDPLSNLGSGPKM